ncbi:helicase-related protein [Parasphingorhabdus sp.]|uniref:helicase-related protein n=1 Tax=Parasphingorhabdus sp. TaxID=2709688 RepID=UPI0035945351
MKPDGSPERDLLSQRLQEDLVGPRETKELLTDRPSDVYLTGILWPQRTEMSGEDDDTLATGGTSGPDDGKESDATSVPISSIQKPSVAGISFCLVSQTNAQIRLQCNYARYQLLESDKKPKRQWQRIPVNLKIEAVDLSIGNRMIELREHNPLALGAQLHIRCIEAGDRKLATVSLINGSDPGQGRDELEMATMFQISLKIVPLTGTILVPKPPRKGISIDHNDRDEASAALLFRNSHEFAAGHTCSAIWAEPENATTEWIQSSWLPSSILSGVDNGGHAVFSKLGKGNVSVDPLSARALALADQKDLREALNQLCGCYADWIELQKQKLDGLSRSDQLVAEENIKTCKQVHDRLIRSVSEVCDNRDLRSAFQMANYAMHIQHGWDPEKAKWGDLRWRPFQLGFLLLSASSSAIPDHEDRATMDLLWFPTGGGKTEAYLALIALVAFYRRVSDQRNGDGVAAIMRYTLRLLTTQQFARSAAMILACEAMRTGQIKTPFEDRLKGHAPLSIGLWVGGEATPNRLQVAWASLNGARDVASPKQLTYCPCCHSQIGWSQESTTAPVIARCNNKECNLFGDLPVWTVDDDVYRERPTLVVGTVDKFAQIVRNPDTNGLFGIGVGNPPDLVVQDELHLISGPLGTVAGTYEAAFDLLFSSGGHKPKVIGSTATIKRATEQVRDLFDREACQFPPSGIDHDDSGFAVHDLKSKGRRYIGVSTAGRSAKFTLQAVAASLLQSAMAAFDSPKKSDPYWTLVGYFNSLRELGGALVLMQDDVTDGIDLIAQARKEKARPMQNVDELTSRRTQDEILDMLEKLSIRVGETGSRDAVLATNMLSVGVDIPRLGLMVVNGQPKTIAEYIQSTSRVGRGSVSGLVVAILNNAKARDRSHFETFAGWHQTLYRDVEATSVTPFASRARDRALHAALVAAVRHLVPDMLDRPDIDAESLTRANELVDLIVERARRIDPEETAVRRELEKRLHTWNARQPVHYWQDYKDTQSLLQSAERAAWKKALGRQPGAAWPTLNSMRNVEAGTPFRLASVLSTQGKKDGE